MYVIQRIKDGYFVARLGRKNSYTNRLQCARTFPTKESAKKDCCGNERAVSVGNILRY